MLLPLVLFVGLIGLLVGSFLNVVIARLPQMLLAPTPDSNAPLFNLLFPGSHCPKCHHAISWYRNIPVLSYCWLRGRCHNCHQKISLRYPAIEILTLLLSMVVAYRFGYSIALVAALLLVWGLVALTFIDFDHTILPDDITLPFLWIGLLLSLFNLFTDPNSAIMGAAFGYLSLWSIYWVFKVLTGKEGMGYGDFKLLALLGAWLGWKALPFIILLSSFLGAVVGLSLIVFRGRNKNTPIPFGPFLAIGGLVVLLWGTELNHFYLKLVGL